MAPIKRSEELVTLSHEHYDGLVFCRNLKHGEKLGLDPTRIAGYIQWFWDNHLHHHFEQEENLLFNQVRNDMIPRALQEHATIKQLVMDAVSNPSYEVHLQLANLVNDHIRFEERELFPALEQQMDRPTIESVGKALNDSHTRGCIVKYNDPFWN